MDNITLDETLQQFADLLNRRFSEHRYTTEDSIRYSLFYCLTQRESITPSDIVLEYPHPKIPGAKVDIYIASKNKRTGLAFEFKFDREIPSGKNSPKPQKAGKIFADIFRLALFNPEGNTKRYFVYVTDREMADYFQNKANHLDDLFNLAPGSNLLIDKNYISRHCATFVKSSGNSIGCEIVCLLNKNLKSDIRVCVFEVK